MKVNTKKYAIALYELVSETPPSKLNLVLTNFAKLLIKKRLTRSQEKIFNDFIDYYNQKEKTIVAKVQTAKDLNDGEKQILTKELERLTGKSVELKTTFEPKILGGIIIKINDCLFDGSLKSKLLSLREKLTTQS